MYTRTHTEALPYRCRPPGSGHRRAGKFRETMGGSPAREGNHPGNYGRAVLCTHAGRLSPNGRSLRGSAEERPPACARVTPRRIYARPRRNIFAEHAATALLPARARSFVRPTRARRRLIEFIMFMEPLKWTRTPPASFRRVLMHLRRHLNWHARQGLGVCFWGELR